MQKNGLYYQSLTFSPLVGLLKNDNESPNVIIYSLSKYMTLVFSRKPIKKGEQLTAAFYVSLKEGRPEMVLERLLYADLFYRFNYNSSGEF